MEGKISVNIFEIKDTKYPITYIPTGNKEYEVESMYNNLKRYIKEGEISC